MPLVRISIGSRTAAPLVEAISDGVHRALVETFGVPENDRFQIITSHDVITGIVGPSDFLGISHTADLVVVQITCAEGRALEQKKKLYASIASRLSEDAGVRSEDVIINLVECSRENWSFGNGLASFAH